MSEIKSEGIQLLKNIGYDLIRKYRKPETLFFYDKKLDNMIRVNLYWGTYTKYKKKTKKQVAFISDEIRVLCKLNEEGCKKDFSKIV